MERRIAFSLMLLALQGPSRAQCHTYFAAVGMPEVGQPTSRMAIHDDGNGRKLFGIIGTGTGNPPYVGGWDGHAWQRIDAGLPYADSMSSLRVLNDGAGERLYLFARTLASTWPYGSIWQAFIWTGQDWVTGHPNLAPGADPQLYFDFGAGSAIYGTFAVTQTHSVGSRWTGEEWQTIGHGDRPVTQLAIYDDGTGPALIAAGNFNTIDGVAAHRVARWDGTDWHPMGSGPNGNFGCRKLAVVPEGPAQGLYFLATATLNSPHMVQHWNGATWTDLPAPSAPPNVIYQVSTIAAFDDGSGPALYLGGTFPTVGGVQARGLARWNGSHWSPVGAGMDYGEVTAFLPFPDDPRGPSLYMRGPIIMAGGDVPSRLVQYVGCPNCYANCDGSTVEPRLNVDDFICFINRFARRDPYANCDQSTVAPAINVEDFLCFINRFAAGCG
jgi:hypothetical protein